MNTLRTQLISIIFLVDKQNIFLILSPPHFMKESSCLRLKNFKHDGSFFVCQGMGICKGEKDNSISHI